MRGAMYRQICKDIATARRVRSGRTTMDIDVEDSPLGRRTAYPERYDASILFPIARGESRKALRIGATLPFRGEDIWTAYELSWLDGRGKPRVAIATLRVPATTPAMIESKSLKLYLNGFAGERFDDDRAVASVIARDLGERCGGEVNVELLPGDAMDTFALGWIGGEGIDELPVTIESYDAPDAGLLATQPGTHGEEVLTSRLFRSNCPVTGQPDWADVQVRYRGPAIDRASLLRYIVSFRRHCGFHEQCVERMFLDIRTHCRTEALTVYARFTRRGGIDINPWRSDDPDSVAPQNVRTARQ